MSERLVHFLSGAVALSYIVAAVFFLKFWRRTREALFSAFASAFLLLAMNQIAVLWLGAMDERSGYAYVLRVVGFLMILGAIVGKNIGDGGARPR